MYVLFVISLELNLLEGAVILIAVSAYETITKTMPINL